MLNVINFFCQHNLFVQLSLSLYNRNEIRRDDYQDELPVSHFVPNGIHASIHWRGSPVFTIALVLSDIFLLCARRWKQEKRPEKDTERTSSCNRRYYRRVSRCNKNYHNLLRYAGWKSILAIFAITIIFNSSTILDISTILNRANFNIDDNSLIINVIP